MNASQIIKNEITNPPFNLEEAGKG